MKLFISWSGTRSKAIAERFNAFLNTALQGLDTFYSEEDIHKGSRWLEIIGTQLESTNFGIICLTKENRSSPWILFEAGALAKNLKSANVSPILFGLDHGDIDGPLSQFQLTAFNKTDIHKMCLDINSKFRRKLRETTINALFDKFWPDVEREIAAILSGETVQRSVSEKSLREITEDIWHFISNANYTDAEKLNDRFTEQLIRSLELHLNALTVSKQDGLLTTFANILMPVEYLIAEVRDKSTQSALIVRYERIKTNLRFSRPNRNLTKGNLR